MKTLPCFYLLLMSFMLSACAEVSSLQRQPEPEALSSNARKLLVDDLLYVLQQLLPARTTTIQFNEETRENYGFLIEALAETGYGLQRVATDQGANFLRVNKVDTLRNDTALTEFSVAVGPVVVGRHYQGLSAANAKPASGLWIEGSARQVHPNLALLDNEQLKGGETSIVEYRDVLTFNLPRITDVSSTAPGLGSDENLPSDEGVNAFSQPVKNVWFTNESNFGRLTQDYVVTRREIIIFGNDSMVLGRDGKQLVRDIWQDFDLRTDVISLLGCSNGYTGLEIGNEGLALGRSRRVVEEFEALGVPSNQLLDEGCWAPDPVVGKYPSRGVVVELKRRGL